MAAHLATKDEVLAKKNEALDAAILRTETTAAKREFKILESEARKAVDEGNADDCSYEELLAAKVYSRFTKGTKVSKAIAAQYLAEWLEKIHSSGRLTVEDWSKRLPRYLVQSIEYVTQPPASGTAEDEQVQADE